MSSGLGPGRRALPDDRHDVVDPLQLLVATGLDRAGGRDRRAAREQRDDHRHEQPSGPPAHGIVGSDIDATRGADPAVRIADGHRLPAPDGVHRLERDR